MIDSETVLTKLPKSGDPIPFSEIEKRLPGWSAVLLDGDARKERAREIRDTLTQLHQEGRAGVIYGRGWRRLPLARSTPVI